MSKHPTLTLTLPLPPSRNVTAGMHHMALHRITSDYKRRAWLAALGQHAPRHPEDLPRAVDLHLTFLTKWERDEDGCDPKYAIDALKAKQRGKVAWRNGLAVEKGYFVDDNPDHAKLVGVQQFKAVDIEPCVIVKITPREAA